MDSVLMLSRPCACSFLVILHAEVHQSLIILTTIYLIFVIHSDSLDGAMEICKNNLRYFIVGEKGGKCCGLRGMK